MMMATGIQRTLKDTDEALSPIMRRTRDADIDDDDDDDDDEE